MKEPTVIDTYIAAQSEEVQPLLQAVRETIRSVIPDATEKISYQMPTFWQGENIVHFAAFKRHIGFFPGGEAVGVFADRLTGYKTSKGTIQFPFSKPIDHELIADIVRWRIGQVKSVACGKTYEYETVIHPADKGGAYVAFPYDIREEFGKGRVKVYVTFDGEPYNGSIVNMGVKNDDGSVCYIIGIRKDIRAKIGKQPGDTICVTIKEST